MKLYARWDEALFNLQNFVIDGTVIGRTSLLDLPNLFGNCVIVNRVTSVTSYRPFMASFTSFSFVLPDQFEFVYKCVAVFEKL